VADPADKPLDLTSRLALRVEEAAALVGLSDRAFREHLLPRCPKFYAGRAVIIPRKPFEEFLAKLAEDSQNELRETARELIARLDSRKV